MSFSLQILGSSSATPTKYRNPSAQVLNVRERLFLIDCGEATQMQLRKYGVKFKRINHVFISHLHGDHYLGLLPWISTLNLYGRTSPLHIYADARVESLMTDHLQVSETKMGFDLIYHPLNFRTYEVIYSDDKLEIASFPLRHRIPTCGFVFKERCNEVNVHKDMIEKYNISVDDILNIKKGADFIDKKGDTLKNDKLTYRNKEYSYAYCSDTAFDETIIPFIKGVDILYHETTFDKGLQNLAIEKMHSTTKDAAEIAKKANVKNLLIGHFSARYKEVDKLYDECRDVFPHTQRIEEGGIMRLR